MLIDAKTLEVVGEFHYYVKPLVNPKLTAFCTELTGITQVLDPPLMFHVIHHDRLCRLGSRREGSGVPRGPQALQGVVGEEEPRPRLPEQEIHICHLRRSS